jgi:L-ornithine N5-oxygenase
LNSVDFGHRASANGVFDMHSGTSGAKPSDNTEDFDLIVAGFGPAALAIAIAIQDALESSQGKNPFGGLSRPPRVIFLEKQRGFAWHSGMLIPGAKMQISFIKDLATMRNPKSNFTFLNYLYTKNRLIQFCNLSTFLPSRVEFQDYLKWCAKHFDDVVSYGEEVVDIAPVSSNGSVGGFSVRSRNVQSQVVLERRARHVIVAVGGKPSIPAPFGAVDSPRVIHSSQYAHLAHKLLDDSTKPYRIAIIGGGQSAAEVFDNLHSRYPNCRTHLIFRAQALRPSDDSPFVNEIFDPARIPLFFKEPGSVRSTINSSNKNTNYGVVRLELIERIYETLYLQRLTCDSEEQWPHRMLTNAAITTVSSRSPDTVFLGFDWTPAAEFTASRREAFDYDLVVLATGYTHHGHEDMLRPVAIQAKQEQKKWAISEDYRLKIGGLNVSKDAGIWLQGCNEETHGVSSGQTGPFFLSPYSPHSLSSLSSLSSLPHTLVFILLLLTTNLLSSLTLF